MKKEEAIRILITCAEKYHSNLENRNVMFVFNDAENHTREFETAFFARNFLHLTGVNVTNKEIVSSTDFYRHCLDRRLGLNDFEFIGDGTTQMKLDVLPKLMSINKISNMVGNYNFTKTSLRTEKLSGTVMACMGFVREDEFYVPNTSLKEDIRDITLKPTQKVIAIYSKSIKEPLYKSLDYLGKNISTNSLKLPLEILQKVDCINLKSTFMPKDAELCSVPIALPFPEVTAYSTALHTTEKESPYKLPEGRKR